MGTGEICFVHIGQAGVQLGNAFWELFCLEQNLLPDGRITPHMKSESLAPGTNNLFYLSEKGAHVPRAVLTDLESSVVDEIRTGAYRRLFRPDSMLTGNEDAASNFARGYYSQGSEISGHAVDAIRRMMEVCDSPQGLVICRSLGGGTGSGLSANILERLQQDETKIDKLEVSVYPAPQLSPVIVEPYNTVLTTHSTIGNISCSFMFDNAAIYEICTKKLNVNRPTYTNLNRLVAQVVSTITACLTSDGSGSVSLREVVTNLVAFPRLHYPVCSASPLVPSSREAIEPTSLQVLLPALLQQSSQVIKLPPSRVAALACILLLRGDVSGPAVESALSKIKGQGFNLVEYSPAGYKVGLSPKPPRSIPRGDMAALARSAVMLANSSSVSGAWKRITNNFQLMYSKRAFVHHYVGEGMEESELSNALANVVALGDEYANI